MLTANNKSQSKFFNDIIHQFPEEKIINPLPQHKLELSQFDKHLKIIPPKLILDFGCGSGRLTIHLLKSGFDVYAVDISTGSLESVKKVYKTYRTESWGKLQTSKTIPDRIKFDAIVGSDILHHVPISDYLKRFYKMLKPRGLLVFTEPNSWHFFWYIYYLLFVSWEIEKGILNCTIPNLTREFNNAGFTGLKIEGHGILPTPLFNFFPAVSNLNVLLGNLTPLKYFAFRFIISAKKPSHK